MPGLTQAARAALQRAVLRAATKPKRLAPRIPVKNRVAPSSIPQKVIERHSSNIERGRTNAIKRFSYLEDPLLIGEQSFKPSFIKEDGTLQEYSLPGLDLLIEEVPTNEQIAAGVRDLQINNNVKKFLEWVDSRTKVANTYDLPIEKAGSKKGGFMDLPLPNKQGKIFRIDRNTGIGLVFSREGVGEGAKYRYNFLTLNWEKLPDNYVETPLLRTTELIGNYWLSLEKPLLQFKKSGGKIKYFRYYG